MNETMALMPGDLVKSRLGAAKRTDVSFTDDGHIVLGNRSVNIVKRCDDIYRIGIVVSSFPKKLDSRETEELCEGIYVIYPDFMVWGFISETFHTRINCNK